MTTRSPLSKTVGRLPNFATFSATRRRFLGGVEQTAPALLVSTSAFSSRTIEAPTASPTDFEPRTHTLSPLLRAQSGSAGLKVGESGPAGLEVGAGACESRGEGLS
jgi:hypothetical protein